MVSRSLKPTVKLLIVKLVIRAFGSMRHFSELKYVFFSKTTRRICTKFFFRV